MSLLKEYIDLAITNSLSEGRKVTSSFETKWKSGSKTPSADEKAKAIKKLKELFAKEEELKNKPDASTGKYAKEFDSISKRIETYASKAGLRTTAEVDAYRK